MFTIKNIMNKLEKLEEIVGSIKNIEPFGIEPDFSSLGLEPKEVLGFLTDEEVERAIEILTREMHSHEIYLMI